MVGSFDGGYGAGLLAAHIGQKKAREIWFLCRQYDAQEALDMGLVNTVVPVAELEAETVSWAREMLRHSPMALRLLKAGLNAAAIALCSHGADSSASYSRNGENSPHPNSPLNSATSRSETPRKLVLVGSATTRIVCSKSCNIT